jgi:hypothetical protein
MARRGVLNRKVTKDECSWLEQDLQKGKEVYKYDNYTYGCIGSSGIAVSDKAGETPFYEVPRNSVDFG